MLYPRTALLATATALVATVGADYYVVPSSVDISVRSESALAKDPSTAYE